jgi:hypothetical protein
MKTPAKLSAYQFPSVIVVFVVLVCKSYSQKPQEAFDILVIEEFTEHSSSCQCIRFYTIC